MSVKQIWAPPGSAPADRTGPPAGLRREDRVLTGTAHGAGDKAPVTRGAPHRSSGGGTLT
ncbi:hypothetical protein [Streptomyces sp. NRRL F-5135]|uniref:hypothetical protein n=1 Tax=Streptomyces sp. NRRL F-5135 TaxID=1463858 RepID=UPI0004CA91DE|nr:hypothetical protein [Streptomyces sp. NRRL F-5135]